MPKKEILLFNDSLDKPTQIYSKKKKGIEEASSLRITVINEKDENNLKIGSP